MSSYFSDMLSLFFPNNCAACQKPLFKNESVICMLCQLHLPQTGFHLIPNNPVAKSFWGKVTLEAATAMYYFHKGEKMQRLIHQLKYKGKKEVGIALGKIFAAKLIEADVYHNCEVIVPVPLHVSKERSRGFNQSTIIAQGIAEVLKKEVVPDLLNRIKATATQTKKHRYERFENTNEVFVLNEKHKHYKNILLVDDVITTGSTIAACADVLHEIPGAKVCVAALAFAHK